MRPAVLKPPFFTVAPSDLHLYGESYDKAISFRCCRFNQTYQGIQITLAYNISVSLLLYQGQSHPGCLATLDARQGTPCMKVFIVLCGATGVLGATLQCWRVRGAHWAAHWDLGESGALQTMPLDTQKGLSRGQPAQYLLLLCPSRIAYVSCMCVLNAFCVDVCICE